MKTDKTNQRDYELRGVAAITPMSYAEVPYRQKASDITKWILKKDKFADAKFIKIMRRVELALQAAYGDGRRDGENYARP